MKFENYKGLVAIGFTMVALSLWIFTAFFAVLSIILAIYLMVNEHARSGKYLLSSAITIAIISYAYVFIVEVAMQTTLEIISAAVFFSLLTKILLSFFLIKKYILKFKEFTKCAESKQIVIEDGC